MRLAVAGEQGPLVIRADVQTDGRGRSGRDWSTEAGNHAATFLFAPGCDAAVLPHLSLVAGVAAIDAVRRVLAFAGAGSAPAVRLKWPNDLLIGPAKLGGILVESTIVGDDLIAMIGIGINIAHAPLIAGRDVTCLIDHTAPPPSPQDLCLALATSLDGWLETWSRGPGFPAIRAAWIERAGPAGELISVNSGDGPVSGRFAGLDIDGALLLLGEDGHRRRFTWGDVTIAMPRDAPAKV